MWHLLASSHLCLGGSEQAAGLWGGTVADSLAGGSEGAPPALLTTGGDGVLRLWVEVPSPPKCA